MKLTKNITKIGAIAVVATASAFISIQPAQAEGIASLFTKKEVKPYKLKTCVVSEEELGSMGDPIRFIYKNQEIKVCCKPCIKKFKKEPQKYLKLIEEATNKLKK